MCSAVGSEIWHAKEAQPYQTPDLQLSWIITRFLGDSHCASHGKLKAK